MPRKNKTLEKTASGRQGLDWTKPKSFETATKRIAKAYNSFVNKQEELDPNTNAIIKPGLSKAVVNDQLENIKYGLGYMKKFDTKKQKWVNDPNRPVFDELFTVGKDGKLKVKTGDAVQKIYEAQAEASKSKEIDKKGKTIVVADMKDQKIRSLYQSTPTASDYLKSVEDDVIKGYSKFSLDEAEREVYDSTIKGTAEKLKAKNPNVDDKEAYQQAKQIVTATKAAVQKELNARASYDKSDEDEISDMYKKMSEAIENGLLEGEDLARADSILHHGGYSSTYADINDLQGLYAKAYN